MNEHGYDFEAELRKITRDLRAFGYSLTKSRDKAEDLYQDAVLRAWGSRNSFMPGTNFKAWVFLIMRNQFYTDKRKSWRQTFLEDMKGDSAGGDWSPENLFTPALPNQHHLVELKETMVAISYLSPAFQEIIDLAMIQGLDYETIALKLNCPQGTVKSRVHRAREELLRYFGMVHTGKGARQDDVSTEAQDN